MMCIELGRNESDMLRNRVEQTDAVKVEQRIRDAQPVNDNLNGTTNVPLDRINPTDIQTANDFKSPEQCAALRR